MSSVEPCKNPRFCRSGAEVAPPARYLTLETWKLRACTKAYQYCFKDKDIIKAFYYKLMHRLGALYSCSCTLCRNLGTPPYLTSKSQDTPFYGGKAVADLV